MSPAVATYLHHTWPLALAVTLLVVGMPLVLITGVLPTNQGSIRRADDPAAYWRWVWRLGLLTVAATAVLCGAFWLGAP